MNRLAGTKIKVVRGYPSESAEVIAMERGEIEGIGNAALGDVARRPDTIRVLYISGSSGWRTIHKFRPSSNWFSRSATFR